jgi:hypothetical protein
MPLPRDILEEMAVRRRAEHSRAERDKVRDLASTALRCLAWSAAGILSILWSAHTTDPLWGRVAFWAGCGGGNGAIVFELLNAYKRGERRGDW